MQRAGFLRDGEPSRWWAVHHASLVRTALDLDAVYTTLIILYVKCHLSLFLN